MIKALAALAGLMLAVAMLAACVPTAGAACCPDWRCSIALEFDVATCGAVFVTDLKLLRTTMTQPAAPKSNNDKPDYVTALEAAYGAPSQAAFGSAVFYEPMKPDEDLAQAALARYRYFTGDLWERYGEEAWLGPWKEVYARKAGARRDIVAELRGMDDRQARLSASVFLDEVEDAENARAALAAVYDDPAVTELRVFNLGDGEAMAGLLVTGRRAGDGQAIFLVFLLD